MKRITSLILILLLGLGLSAQNEDSIPVVNQKNTRNRTLDELYSSDSLDLNANSTLLQSLDGANLDAVKNAYKLSRQRVDSILVADSLAPNFWRVYSYQIPSAFMQANKSPSMAMAIFLPWFLMLSLIIIIILSIKTFFVRPYLYDAEKPSNDGNISSSDEDEDEDDEDLKND